MDTDAHRVAAPADPTKTRPCSGQGWGSVPNVGGIKTTPWTDAEATKARPLNPPPQHPSACASGSKVPGKPHVVGDAERDAVLSVQEGVLQLHTGVAVGDGHVSMDQGVLHMAEHEEHTVLPQGHRHLIHTHEQEIRPEDVSTMNASCRTSFVRHGSARQRTKNQRSQAICPILHQQWRRVAPDIATQSSHSTASRHSANA
jgi:hypothetical protein